MESNVPDVSAPRYKDRRAALIVFGILEIVVGLGAWLLMSVGVMGASFMARQGGAPVGSMVPGLAVYGIAGAVFIVLGIGSLRARRWARALWVVLSTGWLLFGVLGAAMAATWMPTMLRSLPHGQGVAPEGMMMMIMAVMLGFITVFMIVLPLALLVFYRSRHVRATCEAAQATPSWTDACSLPTLGAVLWLSATALILIPMPFAYGRMFPWFGHFLRGGAGIAAWWVVAASCGVAALGLYRGRTWAWLLGLFVMVGLGASGVITALRADMMEVYRSAGLPEAQLQLVEAMGFAGPGYTVGWTLAGLVPMVALLLWARPGQTPVPSPTPSGP